MDKYQPEDDEVAVNIAIDGVRHCLNICGITTPLAQNAIIAEGFIDVMSFSEIREKDVYEMVKTINATPNANLRKYTWNTDLPGFPVDPGLSLVR
jgi:hypothetical protein